MHQQLDHSHVVLASFPPPSSPVNPPTHTHKHAHPTRIIGNMYFITTNSRTHTATHTHTHTATHCAYIRQHVLSHNQLTNSRCNTHTHTATQSAYARQHVLNHNQLTNLSPPSPLLHHFFFATLYQKRTA